VEKVKNETGPYLKQRWQEFNSHPLVAEVRNAGLLGAIELSPDKERRARFDDPGKTGYLCRDFCFKNGLVMRSVNDTMIISPPLIISTEQIDEMFELAWKCLDETAKLTGII
jgi:putrescine aminotransferase